MSVRIDDFEVAHGTEGNVTTWHLDKARLQEEAAFDGEYHSKILVSLGVDGMFEVVSADLQATGMAPALREAVAALTRLYDAVRDVDLDPGRCIQYGEYGRCRARHGESCRFPTEEEMNAELDHQARMRELTSRSRA